MGPLKRSYNKYQVDNHILAYGLAPEFSVFPRTKRTFCLPRENLCTAHSLWAVWFIAGEPWVTWTRWLPPNSLLASLSHLSWSKRAQVLTHPPCPHTVTPGLVQYFWTSYRHVLISAFHNLDLLFFVRLPLIHLMPCSFYDTQKCAT